MSLPSMSCCANFTFSRVLLRSLRSALFRARDERSIPAGGGGVDRDGALGRKAEEIVRAAGLRAGAREALAAERLHAHRGADHVAVHVEVAGACPRAHEVHRVLDAAVN